MFYDPNRYVYFISYAKIPSNISAAIYRGHVGVGFIINHNTGVIEDISCTLLTKTCRNFLKGLIVGHNIEKDDIEELISKINLLFHGHSKKAVAVIVKDNYNKYTEWKEQNRENLLELKTKICYNPNMESFTIENFRKYPDNSTYLISYAKIPHNMSMAFYEGHTGVGLVVDFLTDDIIDSCCTFITQEAKDFVKSILMGCSLSTEDSLKIIVDRIQLAFNGPSQKALTVIMKSNYNKYHQWKEDNKEYIENFK
ncbi:MAG: DUF3870 domain-containing protein [Bacillota bacterium]|nr:DUF3870 domain-containing protein [Bacillota bacterium]